MQVLGAFSLGNVPNDKAETANNNFYFSDTLSLSAGSTISASERRSSVINSMKNPITRTDNSPSFPFPIFFSGCRRGPRTRVAVAHRCPMCTRR